MAFFKHNHSARTAAQQEPDRAVPESSGVLDIKRNRIRGPQFVADILVNDSHPDAERFERLTDKRFQYPPQQDFGQTQAAGLIQLAGLIAPQLFVIKLIGQTFRENRNPVISSHGKPLDNRSCKNISNTPQRQILCLKFFRNKRYRCSGRLADTKRKMSGMPSHGCDEIPPAGRLGIFHDVFHYLDPPVTGCLIPERRDSAGQGDVVINSLRNMRHVD